MLLIKGVKIILMNKTEHNYFLKFWQEKYNFNEEICKFVFKTRIS